jgi:methionyl-tRNA formyltransferase
MVVHIFVNGPHSKWINSYFGANDKVVIYNYRGKKDFYDLDLVGKDLSHASALSIHWPLKFNDDFLTSYKYALNVHPGFIPIGRGTYPIFWNILENTTAGATVHQMTSEIDLGPILYREKIVSTGEDTSGSLWRKIHELEKDLILKTLDKLFSERRLVFYNATETIRPARTKKEFMELLNNPPSIALTLEQINQFQRAFTHHDYDLPTWLANSHDH